jgi:hypothetical protein
VIGWWASGLPLRTNTVDLLFIAAVNSFFQHFAPGLFGAEYFLFSISAGMAPKSCIKI